MNESLLSFALTFFSPPLRNTYVYALSSLSERSGKADERHTALRMLAKSTGIYFTAVSDNENFHASFHYFPNHIFIIGILVVCR